MSPKGSASRDEPDKEESSVYIQEEDVVEVGQVTPGEESETKPKRSVKFWMCIVSLVLSTFVMAVDLSGASTALPTIVQDLKGSEFEWVGSAYALSATAFMILAGGLAQVLGRRKALLLQLFFFSLGSVLCGASTNMSFLIAGRTIQGIGAGGINTLTYIIIADLTTLKERGTYNGIIAIGYGTATAIAPVIAGALAQHGQWRWFFYLNLPICGISVVLILIFLDIPTPKMSFSEKIRSLDFFGNFLIVASTSAVVIALTWGGIGHPWNSSTVLVPLILGNVGLAVFIIYEMKYSKYPLVPVAVLRSRTSLSGYFQVFAGMFFCLALVYYLPVYFQACKLDSSVASGVNLFGIAAVLGPFGLVLGASVAVTGRYRPQLWQAWVALIISAGLMTTLRVDSKVSIAIGSEILSGLGLGTLLTCAYFPVLAPVPVTLNASALAFLMFLRFLAQVWGVTIGGAVLENELTKHLPGEFITQFPSGTSAAYSIIPIIPSLREPLRSEVQRAFADSLRVVWIVLAGVAAAGLVSSFFMEGIPLQTATDERWKLQENTQHQSVEEIRVVDQKK